jgi:hypothetical protein
LILLATFQCPLAIATPCVSPNIPELANFGAVDLEMEQLGLKPQEMIVEIMEMYTQGNVVPK